MNENTVVLLIVTALWLLGLVTSSRYRRALALAQAVLTKQHELIVAQSEHIDVLTSQNQALQASASPADGAPASRADPADDAGHRGSHAG